MMAMDSTTNLPLKVKYCNLDVETLEFDGDTVLCRVCGDKASGFHYGVHACEGCKGFFRRSIQQKIQYRPCLKNQQCNIMRVNRNRCQYCRLKKCVSVGMSRDAVRFGRVPKKEKAKILEQMQRVNMTSQHNYLGAILQNEAHVIQQTIKAHLQTCDFTREKFERFQKKSWQKPEFIDCAANRACPLNPNPGREQAGQKWEDFSDNFTPAIQSVVDFAKGIPGFQILNQDDQVTLLKAGTFEVLLLRLACLFDSQTNTMLFTNGSLYKRPSTVSGKAGFLQESMFDFAERLNELSMTDDEIALFSAIVIIAADRPGLRNMEHVERIQTKLTQGLQQMIRVNHPDDAAMFGKLLMKIPDLRTLNTLHSEKLLGLRMTPPVKLEQKTKSEEVENIESSEKCPAKPANEEKQQCPFKITSNVVHDDRNTAVQVPYYIPKEHKDFELVPGEKLSVMASDHNPTALQDDDSLKTNYINPSTTDINNMNNNGNTHYLDDAMNVLNAKSTRILQHELEKAKILMAQSLPVSAKGDFNNPGELTADLSRRFNCDLLTAMNVEKFNRKRSLDNDVRNDSKIPRYLGQHSSAIINTGRESPELVPSPPPFNKSRSQGDTYMNHHYHFGAGDHGWRNRASSFGERSSMCSGTLSSRSSPAPPEDYQMSPNNSPPLNRFHDKDDFHDAKGPRDTTDFRRWASEMFEKAFYPQKVESIMERTKFDMNSLPRYDRKLTSDNIQHKYRLVKQQLQSPIKSQIIYDKEISRQSSMNFETDEVVNKGIIHANALLTLKDKLLRRGVELNGKMGQKSSLSDDKFCTMRSILTKGATPVNNNIAVSTQYAPGSLKQQSRASSSSFQYGSLASTYKGPYHQYNVTQQQNHTQLTNDVKKLIQFHPVSKHQIQYPVVQELPTVDLENTQNRNSKHKSIHEEPLNLTFKTESITAGGTTVIKKEIIAETTA